MKTSCQTMVSQHQLSRSFDIEVAEAFDRRVRSYEVAVVVNVCELDGLRNASRQRRRAVKAGGEDLDAAIIIAAGKAAGAIVPEQPVGGSRGGCDHDVEVAVVVNVAERTRLEARVPKGTIVDRTGEARLLLH